VVSRTLTELAGPTHGRVTLPLRLMWGPDRVFDLADPDQLLWMYENVLRETTRSDDLRRYLNGRLLCRVWPALNLPRAVRAAWERHHPVLRAPASSTATLSSGSVGDRPALDRRAA
jgi:hypothetical protein